MYVAITRAREKLTLSYAMMRTVFGQTQVTTPSEFLLDIPQEHIEETAAQPRASTTGTMDLIDF
jgi:DNA helicase II / ATP-dependent DNA helicase PcrA